VAVVGRSSSGSYSLTVAFHFIKKYSSIYRDLSFIGSSRSVIKVLSLNLECSGFYEYESAQK
jgi:hypothetical protein